MKVLITKCVSLLLSVSMILVVASATTLADEVEITDCFEAEIVETFVTVDDGGTASCLQEEPPLVDKPNPKGDNHSLELDK